MSWINVVHVGADLFVRREQAEVGVELGRARVIVARRKVHIAPERALFAAHDEQHLRVRLVPDDAVDDVRPGFLEPLRPVDVRFLVESRHELHDRRDFLAAARRRDQDLHQFRFGAGAIHGLLDSDDVRIMRGLMEELHDRLERLERVMQQDVASAHRLEHIVTARGHDRNAGVNTGIEFRAVYAVGNAHQPHEIHRPSTR